MDSLPQHYEVGTGVGAILQMRRRRFRASFHTQALRELCRTLFLTGPGAVAEESACVHMSLCDGARLGLPQRQETTPWKLARGDPRKISPSRGSPDQLDACREV